MTNQPPPDKLLLVADGYPLWIDVAQASIAGEGTAMRFVLPPKGHNLPLRHRREAKLVVALEGQLHIRSGRHTFAHLQQGEAARLAPGVAHRIHQYGEGASTVGVALWPGNVEQAFRDISVAVSLQGCERACMVGILADYEVQWTAGSPDGELHPVAVLPFMALLGELPASLAKALLQQWDRWLKKES
jgi:mannose-6-phosphate isomerase-like protein (cupin superfamily)